MEPPVPLHHKHWCIAVLFLVCFYGYHGNLVQAQSSTANDAYCFEFTWLGPQFTNESLVNGTCEDMEPKPPVCVGPLVYTYDGTRPNTTQMWQDTKTREKVGCRLANSEVCAKWTYFYNGEVENVTYLCTKITVDETFAMTGGCERQSVDGHVVEVCACRTPRGANVPPCNLSPTLAPIPTNLLLLFIFLLLSMALLSL